MRDVDNVCLFDRVVVGFLMVACLSVLRGGGSCHCRCYAFFFCKFISTCARAFTLECGRGTRLCLLLVHRIATYTFFVFILPKPDTQLARVVLWGI